MVEGATDAIGFGQVQRTVADNTTDDRARGDPHCVRRRPEADALIGPARAAEHCKARRGARGGDHVLGYALGPGGIDLDVVADAGRNVLDLQRSHHRAAPLVAGMTGNFRQVGRRGGARRQNVVRAGHVMRIRRNLKQAPGRPGCCRRCPVSARRHRRCRWCRPHSGQS